MAGVVIALNQWANVKVPFPYPADTEQPQAFSGQFLFSSTQQTDQVDLTADYRAIDFSLRCVFIDNSKLNAVTINLVIPITGQVIIAKPNTQGYYPVIAPDHASAGANLQIQANAPSANQQFVVPVQLLNIMVEAVVWPTV